MRNFTPVFRVTGSFNCLIAPGGADSFDGSTYANTGFFNNSLLVNFLGGGGNDEMGGSTRNDKLWGGTGNDTEYGYAGDDKVYGEEGDDVLLGQDGNDLLGGGVDNDALVEGNGADVVWGGDGADTLTDKEKLSFKDVSNVDLTIGSPLPVKDTLTTSSSGAAITRTGSHLISKLQLLANDKDWDSAVTDLRILAVSQAKGGTVSLTASGDVLFTPDASYTGVMGFKYQVADAQNNITQVNVGTGKGVAGGTGAAAQTAPMKAAVFLASADLQDSQARMDPLLIQQRVCARRC
ncbi:hypothetical protein B9Z51_05805 [Limnohabitans sp. T6-5]|uniref:cadherin-like domain-containing protein n=1 Tax=Limnohabitans sp. T6-5 TaxID=1100724 RepID=UPI000D344EA7|nr:cadherin-like domain-containing protein [Limnohabitans sp. T6-5]PUE08482.1 hypothetical protein B9Z51_05805 [Limnohabitans sp. T6-5]